MGFLVNKITGNGTPQTVVTNDATLEAVVNSLVAFNTTGGALSFSLLVNDSVILFWDSILYLAMDAKFVLNKLKTSFFDNFTTSSKSRVIYNVSDLLDANTSPVVDT